MSTLFSTSEMVAKCQTRLPIGLSSIFWMDKLNEAFRWVSQKGNFVWDVKRANLIMPFGTNYITLPGDVDPGKPMWIVGPISGTAGQAGNLRSDIPYKPWDEAQNQDYSEITPPPGAFSCFSIATEFTGAPPTYAYRAVFFPSAAMATLAEGDFAFDVKYHVDVSGTEYTEGVTTYFPTPNAFDSLFVELAEAEAKRIYGIAGWDIIQKRAESGIVSLLDAYRSTKNTLAGMVDQQKQLSEKKMMVQERA